MPAVIPEREGNRCRLPFFLDHLGRREPRESDVHILRLGLAAADDGKFYGAAGLAGEKHLSLVDGHLAGGESSDLLDHVAHMESGFGGGAIGKSGDHGDITETLGERKSGGAFGFVGALFLVIGVFERADVAGLRIEGIEQAVQGAGGDPVDIGIVDVVALNVLENFAIGGKRAEGLVVRRSGRGRNRRLT